MIREELVQGAFGVEEMTRALEEGGRAARHVALAVSPRPLLRYVGETEATIWVETDSPCDRRDPRPHGADIHGRGAPLRAGPARRARTGRLLRVRGQLDGERGWPRGVIRPSPERDPHHRPRRPDRRLFRLLPGRAPHEEPYVETKDRHYEGKEFDALRFLPSEMIRGERDEWPEFLFLLGDQVYVDEGSPRTRERIREGAAPRRPPGEEVTDYEEYSWLYEESWSDPLIRWLLSTVSISMHWDDHDMSDDWNISPSWLEEMRQKSWWHRRATAGMMSYWVYQHLGNLSPEALDADDLYGRVRGNVHATAELREFAAEVESTGSGTRWSFCRDLGGTRVIFIDSRAGRVLGPGRADRRRRRVGLGPRAGRGGLRPPAVRDHGPLPALARLPSPRGLERAGLRRGLGRTAARAAEKLRRASTSTTGPRSGAPSSACASSSRRSARGRRGPARPRSSSSPATSTTPIWPRSGCAAAEVTSAVYQAVCSPYRNPLDSNERRVIRAASPVLSRRRAGPRPGRGSADPGLAGACRGPLLRQPGGDDPPRRPRIQHQARQDVGGRRGAAELDCVFERRLA